MTNSGRPDSGSTCLVARPGKNPQIFTIDRWLNDKVARTTQGDLVEWNDMNKMFTSTSVEKEVSRLYNY